MSLICRRLFCFSRVMPIVGNVKSVANVQPNLKCFLAEQCEFRSMSTSKSLFQEVKRVKITFVRRGERTTVDARVGGHLLDAVKEGGLNIDEYGTCGGNKTCSSCHCMLQPNVFEIVPKMDMDEDDKLDILPDRTDFSRLGCQVVVTEDMDGTEVTIPDEIEDTRGIHY